MFAGNIENSGIIESDNDSDDDMSSIASDATHAQQIEYETKIAALQKELDLMHFSAAQKEAALSKEREESAKKADELKKSEESKTIELSKIQKALLEANALQEQQSLRLAAEKQARELLEARAAQEAERIAQEAAAKAAQESANAAAAQRPETIEARALALVQEGHNLGAAGMPDYALEKYNAGINIGWNNRKVCLEVGKGLSKLGRPGAAMKAATYASNWGGSTPAIDKQIIDLYRDSQNCNADYGLSKRQGSINTVYDVEAAKDPLTQPYHRM